MPGKKIVTVGIDASTTATGVSVFSDGTYIESTVFKPEKVKFTSKKARMSKTAYKTLHAKEKREDMERRVLFMISNIGSLLDRCKPSRIIMEDTYGQSDMMTFKMLSRIQGAVIDWARRNNAELAFKTPSKWRKEVGIPQKNADGTAMKRDQYKEFAVIVVNQLYGVKVSDDEAEAICIGASGSK